MTLPLITIKAPCGCPLNEGHYCCPPWVDETDWPVSGDVSVHYKCLTNAVSLGVINEKRPTDQMRKHPVESMGLTPLPDEAGRELPPMVVDARPLDNTSEESQ